MEDSYLQLSEPGVRSCRQPGESYWNWASQLIVGQAPVGTAKELVDA
jgi:hypothetical protein